MEDRKYPTSLFISGLILKIIKRWYLLAIALLLFIIRLFVPSLPILLPAVILLFCIAIAFIEQLAMRSVAMKSEDDVFDKLFGASGSADWRSNVTNMVNEKIKEQLQADDTDV